MITPLSAPQKLYPISHWEDFWKNPETRGVCQKALRRWIKKRLVRENSPNNFTIMPEEGYNNTKYYVGITEDGVWACQGERIKQMIDKETGEVIKEERYPAPCQSKTPICSHIAAVKFYIYQRAEANYQAENTKYGEFREEIKYDI